MFPPIHESRQCRAHSSQTGQPCRRWAIRGARVCYTHGGAIGHVKKAAAERIAEMVDPALTELARLVEAAETDAVKLAAIKDVLDRAGYKATERVDLTSKGESFSFDFLERKQRDASNR